MPVTIEREVKLRFESVDAARAAILATERDAAAVPASPGGLAARRRAGDACGGGDACLRVRIESGKSLLTFKGPVQHSPVKVREEVETVVGDGTVCCAASSSSAIACGSAIRSTARSTRSRTSCSPSTKRRSACSSRSRAASRGSADVTRLLGLSERDYVLDSYRGLFVEHRRMRGLPATDMLFDE